MSGGTALEAGPSRFVIAYRDIAVTRNGIGSTIRAGAPVLASDDAVRAAPSFFFSPVTYVFALELEEVSESGRSLKQHIGRDAIENLPPPGPNAAEYWTKWWSARLEAGGSKVRNLVCEQHGPAAFVVRGQVDRAPAEVVEVESTLSDGRVATSTRKTYR